ncbi:hypothetical protein KUL42_01190 [Alteromonas sp. KUL42]|nr:hypothetical protein KUL42_01190 [Alteromonas sp. KUL42]
MGEVHPLSLKYLGERGYKTEGLKSQSWDEFEAYSPDLVVTVCDSAAGESCPIYFGQSLKVHWGLEDPSKLEGTDSEKASAFNQTMDIIEKRVLALAEIAEQTHTKETLKKALIALGAQ